MENNNADSPSQFKRRPAVEPVIGGGVESGLNHAAQHFYLRHGFANSQIQQRRHIADFSFLEWVFVREQAVGFG